MGKRCSRTGRRQPVGSASFEALSDAATASEILGCNFRARRAEAGLASLSRAHGDSLSSPPGTKRVRELRILSGIWLRSRSEIELTCYRHSNGGEDGPVRNSAQCLRASD